MNQNKKEPYTGDPNTTMTICAKKLRRHLRGDLAYIVIADEATVGPPTKSEKGEKAVPLESLAVICRHCKQDPYIAKDDEAEPEAISA